MPLHTKQLALGMELLYQQILAERASLRRQSLIEELLEKENIIHAFLSSMQELGSGTDCTSILQRVEAIALGLKTFRQRLDGHLIQETKPPTPVGGLINALDDLSRLARERLTDYENQMTALSQKYTACVEKLQAAFQQVQADHLAEVDKALMPNGSTPELLGGLNETAAGELLHPLDFKASARKVAAMEHQALSRQVTGWKKEALPSGGLSADWPQPPEFPTAEAIQACFRRPVGEILEDFVTEIFSPISPPISGNGDDASPSSNPGEILRRKILSAGTTTCSAICKDALNMLENALQESCDYCMALLTRSVTETLFEPDHASGVQKAILELRRRLRDSRGEPEPSLTSLLKGETPPRSNNQSLS